MHQQRRFDTELANLKSLLTDMASKVEEMIAGSVQALIQRDRERAKAIMPLEQRVNELELEVDEAALRLLALRQPMAIDLRYITGAMKIGTDLERMGDLAEKLSKLVLELDKAPPRLPPPDLPAIARVVEDMARECIAAFVRQDPERAAAVIWRDDEVDRLRHDIIGREKKAMASGEENIEPGVCFILAARALERIADHATNIAEDVVYMVEGEVVKHGPRPAAPEEEDTDFESE